MVQSDLLPHTQLYNSEAHSETVYKFVGTLLDFPWSSLLIAISKHFTSDQM